MSLAGTLSAERLGIAPVSVDSAKPACCWGRDDPGNQPDGVQSNYTNHPVLLDTHEERDMEVTIQSTDAHLRSVPVSLDKQSVQVGREWEPVRQPRTTYNSTTSSFL